MHPPLPISLPLRTPQCVKCRLPCAVQCVPISCLFYIFLASSVGKESARSAGDPGSIPGSGRSAGEGIGYPLQCSWAALVAQLVKNPPAVRETWVGTLGWEDPLEKGKATHFGVVACRIPWTV